MKKFGAILVAVLCICCMLTFTGCSKVEGTYKFESMSYVQGGISINVEVGEEYQGVSLNEDFYVLEIAKDGTFTMTVMSMHTMEGTWEKVDGKYVLTADDEPITVEIKGKTLTMEEDGAKIVLKKQ